MQSKGADFEKIRRRATRGELTFHFLAALRAAQHGLYTSNLLPTPMEYLLLTAREDHQWFCPLCIRSKLPIASLNVSAVTTPSMSLLPKIDEVSTTLSDVMVPTVVDMGKTFSVSDGEVDELLIIHRQHRGMHSARKQRAKNRKYYEENKQKISSMRKKKYHEHPEPKKDAAHAVSKVNYAKNPQPKKAAARAASKVNYAINPQPKKDAARAASKVNYAKNPKIKIGHSHAHYVKNKQSICAKKGTNIHCVSQSFLK